MVQRDVSTKNNNPDSRSLLGPTLHSRGFKPPRGGRFARPLNSRIWLAVVNRGVMGPAASRTDASRSWQQRKHWAEGSGLVCLEVKQDTLLRRARVYVDCCPCLFKYNILLVLCCQAPLLAFLVDQLLSSLLQTARTHLVWSGGL